MKRFAAPTVFVVSLAAAVYLAAVGGGSDRPPADDDRLSVVTTFYPLAEFSQNVGGDQVHIRNLTPPGIEPHDFEPSPRDMAAIQKADIFVYNGAGLEPWVAKILPDLRRGGAVVIDTSAGISILEGVDDHEEDGNGHDDEDGHDDAAEDDHDHGPEDPHFWLDPILAGRQVDNIMKGLIKADPDNRELYEANAGRYRDKLARLDREFREGLAPYERREIVISHASLAYVARRYDLKMVPIAGISTEDEPSPRRLRAIARYVQERDVRYIFVENLVSPRLAETIARETGAKITIYDQAVGLTDAEIEEGKTYLTIQRDNLKKLKKALADR
jgi:zinc transport system substrate-binding protein